MTKAERVKADAEEEYFRRGLALNTSRKPYSSLGTGDRLIACLHELEGGVNNGGFGTYLSNTGGARMADAHRYLLHIGARRTARVIADVRALFPRGFGASFRRDPEAALETHRERLDRLSNRFYDLAESVPRLAMRYVESPKPGATKSHANRKRRK